MVLMAWYGPCLAHAVLSDTLSAPYINAISSESISAPAGGWCSALGARKVDAPVDVRALQMGAMEKGRFHHCSCRSSRPTRHDSMTDELDAGL